ncbi:hypothetical protein [Burkholderia cepacia]|uniref:hypothetical protein n=1 Tax=Burkholderia cepacia TaxID=292 RepID=UPI00398F7869
MAVAANRHGGVFPRAERIAKDGWPTFTRDGVEVWNCSARNAAAKCDVQSAQEDLPMSQLVQIAPGVVFSADVLGVEWARKYRQTNAHASSSEDTEPEHQSSGTTPESNPAAPSSMPGQMSLL